MTGATPDSLRLSWTVARGRFASFVIQYKDAQGQPRAVPVPGEESAVTIPGLEPGRKYKMTLYGLHGRQRVGPVSVVAATGESGLQPQPARPSLSSERNQGSGPGPLHTSPHLLFLRSSSANASASSLPCPRAPPPPPPPPALPPGVALLLHLQEQPPPRAQHRPPPASCPCGPQPLCSCPGFVRGLPLPEPAWGASAHTLMPLLPCSERADPRDESTAPPALPASMGGRLPPAHSLTPPAWSGGGSPASAFLWLGAPWLGHGFGSRSPV